MASVSAITFTAVSFATTITFTAFTTVSIIAAVPASASAESREKSLEEAGEAETLFAEFGGDLAFDGIISDGDAFLILGVVGANEKISSRSTFVRNGVLTAAKA